MEHKNLMLFVGAFTLTMCTIVITYVITISTKQQCSSDLEPVSYHGLRFAPKPAYDVSDTMHIPEKKITLIKGVGSGKCYVVSDDSSHNTDRALTPLNSRLTPDNLRTMAGEKAVEFCHDSVITPVRILSDNDNSRNKRGDKVAEEQQKKFKSHSNECAESVIVQCADGNQVYKCVTGPREVYRASTECKSATQFTFNLTTRCKEFDATKNDRFIKCLQKFILNQQGTGGNAPAQI